jgi:hypothetical protein
VPACGSATSVRKPWHRTGGAGCLLQHLVTSCRTVLGMPAVQEQHITCFTIRNCHQLDQLCYQVLHVPTKLHDIVTVMSLCGRSCEQQQQCSVELKYTSVYSKPVIHTSVAALCTLAFLCAAWSRIAGSSVSRYGSAGGASLSVLLPRQSSSVKISLAIDR